VEFAFLKGREERGKKEKEADYLSVAVGGGI